MSAPSENLAGDLGQQLQQIVRGELRKMLEVSIPYLFDILTFLVYLLKIPMVNYWSINYQV